ncbi:hypothetical protein AVEN_234865-1 [Araneus ventricosus]|uniref:Integrase catalytic domain-containing protein n=1 Tax=Araneus ventricosus TaxID=182803 RepID=A0A4Y2IFV3_ARAVE|nr:hypothetical protein AVEN_234865-1 [Araneus ventricosus]
MILHSDEGTNFNSSLYTEHCKLLGILKTRTTALHPESDGLVERSADHEVTGFSPADILFGRTLRLPYDILFGRPSDTASSPNEYLNNLEARLESVHVFARERMTRYDSGATGDHFKKSGCIT